MKPLHSGLAFLAGLSLGLAASRHAIIAFVSGFLIALLGRYILAVIAIVFRRFARRP